MKSLIFLIFLFTGIIFVYSQNNICTAIKNGNWNNNKTWNCNKVPTINDRVIISKNISVNLVNNHEAKEIIIQGKLNVIKNNKTNKQLTTNWIHVNNGGVFEIGTKNNRFNKGNFTLNLIGTNLLLNHEIPVGNGNNTIIKKNNGFLMITNEGKLTIYGKKKLSFTRLSKTAYKNDSYIEVANIIDRNNDGNITASEDGLLDWQVGDKIVIASSTEDYSKEDVCTIMSVTNLGTNSRLTLNKPLDYKHYGKIETYAQNYDPESFFKNRPPINIDLRAEVALLNRNIKIQGTALQDTDVYFGDREKLQIHNGKAANGIGGHIMIMSSSGAIEVDGVQLNLMGQAGRLGRYPFHWHKAKNRSGDFIKNSSITNSNNRAIVVHATNNVIIENVVAHDIHGHTFFTEDGVEEGNQFINNIALGVHKVHSKANKGSAFVVDDTDKFHDGGARFSATAAFWIANANNKYIGNICAGSQGSGFWFAPPIEPRGTSKDDPEYKNYKPREIPLDVFKNNSAHSTATGLVLHAGRIVLGEYGENEKHFGTINPVFENFTAYQNDVGFYPLFTNITSILKNFKAADNGIMNHDSDPTLFDGGLIVGKSRGNNNKSVIGTTLYHGNTVFKNIHIAGFKTGRFFKNGTGNRVRPGCEVEGLSFENDGSYSGMLNAQKTNPRDAREVYDRDGSLTTKFGGGSGYTFIGNTDWHVDESLGEIKNYNKFKWILSQQRFGCLQTKHGDNNIENIPEIIFTSPHGITQSLQKAKVTHKRIQLRLNSEYRLEFPNGFDTSKNHLQFSLYQWSLPQNTAGVVLKMVDMANIIKPIDYVTKLDLPIAEDLTKLRESNQDMYYKSNNDLFVKLMNRSKGTHSGYIDFVENLTTMGNKKNLSNKHNNLSKETIYKYNIYPNPVKNHINISSKIIFNKGDRIQIIDLKETTLIDKLILRKQNSFTLSVNNLSNGIYFLNIITKQQKQTKKIIINN